MKTALRAFLSALAITSMVAFCGPVSAGMIESPKLPADDVQTRQAAIEILTSRLAESGADAAPMVSSLEAMPTDNLVAMASASNLYAGRHRHHRALYWATIGVWVWLWYAIVDGFRHHHHHHHH